MVAASLRGLPAWPVRVLLRLAHGRQFRHQVQLFAEKEAGETFAAQIVANGKAFDWDWERVNVNGGAIALGHPLGATGARLVVTLLHALQQRGKSRGIAGLCHGGGGAVAMAFELV